MTPELKDLADYHVVPRPIDVIGISAGILKDKLGTPKVGIMALSFAGRLALLAATNHDYARNTGFIVTVVRMTTWSKVSRFFATNVHVFQYGDSTQFCSMLSILFPCHNEHCYRTRLR